MYVPEELKKFLNPDGTLDLEKTEIASGWQPIPDGQYVMKLTGIEVQEVDPAVEWKKFPSLQCTFTIQSGGNGKNTGSDHREWWSLEVSPPKEGKTGLWAPDIARIKQYAAAIGKPIGAFPAFEPEKARKVVAQTFGQKMLDCTIKTTKYSVKDRMGKPTGEQKEKTRMTILGLHGTSNGAPGASPVPATAGAQVEADPSDGLV